MHAPRPSPEPKETSMTPQILALAERLKIGEAAHIELSHRLIAAVKAARDCPALRDGAEVIMAHHPRDFPLFGARQAD
jgi:hypothetical protein